MQLHWEKSSYIYQLKFEWFFSDDDESDEEQMGVG